MSTLLSAGPASKQGDAHRRVLREPRREHAAGRAAADDEVVELAFRVRVHVSAAFVVSPWRGDRSMHAAIVPRVAPRRRALPGLRAAGRRRTSRAAALCMRSQNDDSGSTVSTTGLSSSIVIHSSSLVFGRQADVVGAFELADVDDAQQLLGQRRAVDEHAEFGVGAGRARVEVHRADEDRALVDHRRLRVEPPERGAEHAEPLGRLGARRAQLVEIDAGLEHRRPVARIAVVHQRLVGGGERIGDDGHLDVLGLEPLHRGDALVARDHVRRGQHQVALGLPDLHHHAVGDAHLVGDLRRHREQLFRRIGEGAGLAPLQADLAGLEVFAERAVAEHVDRRRVGGRRGRKAGEQRIEGLLARHPVAERLADRFDREDDFAVPVAVEDLRHVLHDGAHHEGVHVDEVRLGAAQEVLVGDVAAADHRHHAVGDEHLVVHAVVEAAEVEERRRVAAGDAFRAGAAERIEQAHLDVRERRQAAQQRVRLGGVEVVDEQAQAHATHRGVAQRRHQQPPGRVVLELVVLHVERDARPLRQLQARVEREGAEGHQPHARLVGCRQGDARHLDERAVRVHRQGRRIGAADVAGQRAAAGQAEREGGERGSGAARERSVSKRPTCARGGTPYASGSGSFS